MPRLRVRARQRLLQLIAVNHDNQEPILIAGDSSGDYAMLTDFPKLQMASSLIS